MFRSYDPDFSKPKPSVRRSLLGKTNNQINNLQPSQLLNRPFPSLPYSPDTQQIRKTFKLQYSDVTYDEYSKL